MTLLEMATGSFRDQKQFEWRDIEKRFSTETGIFQNKLDNIFHLDSAITSKIINNFDAVRPLEVDFAEWT